MTRLLPMILVALLAGCSTQIASLDHERSLTEQEIAERHAFLASPQTMQPTPSEKFDIAVVGGNCAPKVNAKLSVTACVNDKPCNGFGTRLPDGQLVCACYEVAGGCESGTFCNHRTHQCVKLPADQYHTR